MKPRTVVSGILTLGLVVLACTPPESAGPVASPTAGPLPVVAPAGPCRVALFIWSEYIDPEVVADFERENDCRVTIETFASDEALIASLESGGTARYDIVVPSDYSIQGMIRRGLIAPLRHERIPNLANLDDRFVNPAFDPGNEHSVPYQWGTVGIYLRRGAGPPARSWRLIFDPAHQVGPFVLLDSQRDMMGSVLRYLGHSVNTTDPREIAEAAATLREARRRSAGFQADVGGRDLVLAGKATAAVAFNGDAVRGMVEDPATLFFVPEEGSVIWVDNLAIPARAPHRDSAERFINYLLDARVGARISNYNHFASPNRAARPYIAPADLANEAIYPPARIMTRLEWVRDLGNDNTLYDKPWQQLKAE